MSKLRISNGVKKYLAIIFLVIMLLGLAGFAQAATTIIEDYPEIPGAVKPGEARAGEELPRFIQYIFQFALGIVGVVGLIAIIIAAFSYVTSAGNPQKAADAKDRIVSALLGILLLLGSWILLNIINPDLLKLGIQKASGVPPMNIPDSETGKQCRPLKVAWEKPKINAGEATYLVFTLNKYCAGQESSVEIVWTGATNSFLRQDRPAAAGSCPTRLSRGWDPYCGIYDTRGAPKASHDKDGLIVLKYQYEFGRKSGLDSHCRGKDGMSECPALICPKITGKKICNFKLGEPERFYIEGSGKMHDGTTFYVPAYSIIVEDNK